MHFGWESESEWYAQDEYDLWLEPPQIRRLPPWTLQGKALPVRQCPRQWIRAGFKWWKMEGGSNKISHTVQLGSILEFDKQSAWLGPWGRNISAVFPQFWLSGQVRQWKSTFQISTRELAPKIDMNQTLTKKSSTQSSTVEWIIARWVFKEGHVFVCSESSIISSFALWDVRVVGARVLPEWQQEIIGAAVENANRTITAEMLDIVIRKHTGNATSELSY